MLLAALLNTHLLSKLAACDMASNIRSWISSQLDCTSRRDVMQVVKALK